MQALMLWWLKLRVSWIDSQIEAAHERYQRHLGQRSFMLADRARLQEQIRRIELDGR